MSRKPADKNKRSAPKTPAKGGAASSHAAPKPASPDQGPAWTRIFLPLGALGRTIRPKPAHWRSLGRPVFAAVFCALLARLGYPPFDFPLVGAAGFVGFLWFFAKNRRYMDGRNGFWFGWWWGFAFFYSVSFWLNETVRYNPASPLGIVAMSAWLALWTGLFGSGAGWVARNRPNHFILLSAAWWTLTEAGRGAGVLGFPFYPLGGLFAAKWPWLLLGQEILLYSFLVAGACAAVAAALNRWWAIAGFDGPEAGRAWLAQVGTIGAVAFVCWFAATPMRVVLAETDASPYERLRVALLQPNISQQRKMGASDDLNEANAIFGETMSLGLSIKPGEVDLVVFPESPFTGFNDALAEPGNALAPFCLDYVKRVRAAAVFGGANVVARRLNELDPETGSDKVVRDYFNSNWLVLPTDAQFPAKRVYDKRNLVPFGEHIPLIGWIPGMEDLFRIGQWNEGKPLPPLPLNSRVSLGSLICFETSNAGLARDALDAGASLLVANTNDAWFERSSGLEHHYAHAIYRAYETGLPIVQAANTGVTCLVDPAAGVVLRLPRHQRGALRASIGLPNPIALREARPSIRLGLWWWLGACSLYWLSQLAPAILRRVGGGPL